jgi:hypothetical protein
LNADIDLNLKHKRGALPTSLTSFLHELRFVFVVPALAENMLIPAKAGTTNTLLTLMQKSHCASGGIVLRPNRSNSTCLARCFVE